MAERPTSFIFDLDGTLVDSLPGIEFSVEAAFVACNLPKCSGDLRCKIGPPIRSILAEVGNLADPKMLSELEDAFRRSYDFEGWKRSVCYPSVTSVLQRLHASGDKLFVVTNKPGHISFRILDLVGIFGLFEQVLTRDSREPEYSNKEEMVRYLLTRYHIAPETCLMTGDTMEDARAASASGIQFAHVTYGYGTIAEGSPVPVHFTYDNFKQFSQQLAQEFAHDR
jgi:phosphoglycolate phosphatase